MAGRLNHEFISKYRGNVHSQNGEDGVLKEILRRLNITSGYVCEFGAWDGVYLSNTFDLIQRGFKSVLIEGDEEKFKDLEKLSATYATITPICAYVDHIPGSETSLDNLLKKTDIPYDFDVLSIDIDSFDYQVWDSFKNYMPKIVVIEINSSIAFSVPDHIHTPGKFEGTSFLPMMKLAEQKGYSLVGHTGNLIFIRRDLYSIVNPEYVPSPPPRKLALKNGRMSYN
jgi:hypothetical protein